MEDGITIPYRACAPRCAMTFHLVILAVYSLSLMALGLWIGRRVRGASDFFVAGRQLGPGLIFSTMLAANIGAGSTVGATVPRLRRAALRRGGGWDRRRSARWCWRFWIGPAMRRVAAARDLRTVGDYLDTATAASVRAIIAAAALGRLALHPRRAAHRHRLDPRTSSPASRRPVGLRHRRRRSSLSTSRPAGC